MLRKNEKAGMAIPFQVFQHFTLWLLPPGASPLLYACLLYIYGLCTPTTKHT
jgi:hypothetical protein